VADTIWLHRFVQHQELSRVRGLVGGFPHPTSLRQRLARSLAELREYRTNVDDVVVELASQVTEGQLAGTLRYASTSGQPQARNFGALVQHFFNHQTHHRGQATTLLFQAGVDLGATDLLAIIASDV
jgi:uncharacterized damage-inducible protein DinB